MREGAFSYFSGPFEHAALVDMVRQAMDSPCWDDGIEVLSETPAWVRLAARCDVETANRLIQFLHGAKDPSIPEADREATYLPLESGSTALVTIFMRQVAMTRSLANLSPTSGSRNKKQPPPTCASLLSSSFPPKG